ncbi:MAG: S-layer homology domain-containing protein [bacterium]|nr:S-layer homology domain-containing protein [bacterium]
MHIFKNKLISILISVSAITWGTGVFAQEKPDYSSAPSAQEDKNELMNSDDIKVKFYEEGETYYSKYTFTKNTESDYTFIYGISAESDSEINFKLNVYNEKSNEPILSTDLTAKGNAQEYDFPDELLEEDSKYYYTITVTEGSGNGFIHLEWEYISERTESIYKDIDQDDNTLKRAVISLRDSGIMEGYEDGTFKPDKEITRAELSKLMYKIDNSDGANKNYTDVTSEHWAYEYISKSKYFKGYEDGSFRPDENILIREALTAAVRAAGLEEQALDTGKNYPHNYTIVALTAGLTEGINQFQGNSPTTRRDAALIIYNAVNFKNTNIN